MKRLAVLAMCLLSLASAVAQTGDDVETDVSTWITFNVHKKLYKDLSIQLHEEFRSYDHMTKTDYWITSVLFHYKAVKWLKLSLGYDYLSHKVYGKTNGSIELDPYFQNTHRLYFDLTGSWKTGQFSFGVRERYIYAHTMAEGLDYIDASGNWQRWEYSKENDDHKLRSKVTIAYDIRKTPLQPYVANELFFGTDFFQQSRLFAGLGIRASRISSFQVYYMWQYKVKTTPKFSNHVIGLDYTIKID